MKIELKVASAWREFAASSGIDQSSKEAKLAFYAGVKWMDNAAGGCHLLTDNDLMALMMSVKAELAEFSGQSLQQYLAHTNPKS